MRISPLLTLAFLLLAATAPLRWTHAQEPAPAATDAAERSRELLRQGREALRAGDRFTALRLVARARDLQPADPDTRQALADVLAELGAYEAAAAAIAPKVDPGVRGRQAGARVRWGESIDPPDAARRFEATDVAIAQLQALLAQEQGAPSPDPGLLFRLQRDLVVALRARERWADALEQAQALRAAGDVLPPYARRAEAGALLEMRRPAEARQAYQEVLRADPDDRIALVGRFWSELEEEDFDAAFATADALAAIGGPTRQLGRVAAPQRDDDWLDAQLLAAKVRRFADMPAAAWDRIEPLVREAPGSSTLREERGEIAAARGWNRLGEEELRIARSLVVEDPGLEMALAESDLRRRRWASAEERVARLAPLYPGNGRLLRLQRDLAAWRMAELQLEIQPRIEQGDSSVAPGDGLSARARLYTPPLAERWRLLADVNRESGQPRDEKLVRNRFGAGVEGRWPDVTLELIGWANTGMLDRPGATANLQWQPDDHWTLAGFLEAFTPDTPLQAVKAGIHADRLGLSAVHAWNESRVASVGVQTSDFSDGNRRWSAVADFSARVLDAPTTKVALTPAFYTSRNSRSDAPYFNPRRDAALTLAIDVQDRIWRRYERSWLQRVLFSAGPYWQDGFGTRVIASVSYEQAWRVDPVTEWRCGVSLSRRYYDGDAEAALAVFVRLQQRF